MPYARYIVLMRHGDYVIHDLSEEGRSDAHATALQIREVLRDTKSRTLVCSDRPRVQQTRSIVNKALADLNGVQRSLPSTKLLRLDGFDLLYEGDTLAYLVEKARGVDALIVVGHKGFAKYVIPHLQASLNPGTLARNVKESLEMAEAFVLDTREGHVIHIAPWSAPR